MIYLDYSATTPVDDRVLRRFVKHNKIAFANPNSHHALGFSANRIVEDALQSIRSSLFWKGIVVPTSGATEANNLAILGIAKALEHQGRHLITTAFEHSSVTACFQKLQKEGFEVDIVDHRQDGTVDLDDLKRLLRHDTILVSVAAVQSEIGFMQDLSALSACVHEHSRALFHTDATQAIGKTTVDLSHVDLASLTAHKIYGLKGVGALLIAQGVALTPQILGGHSTTVFRSGTPSAPLIDSLAYAIRLAIQELPMREQTTHERYLRFESAVRDIPGVHFNRTPACLPHIVNFSIESILAGDLQARLSQRDIMISTQSACRQGDQASLAVLRLFEDERRAQTSVRVSLSHWTTEDDIDRLIDALKLEVAR
jgi:cysteine desulfurase